MELPSFVYSRFTKLSGICLILLLTSQNASAFNLNMNDLNINKLSSNLTYDNLVSKLPTLFIFQERNAAYMVKEIKNKYLTFYSNKNENLKATYDSGAYLITYTSNW